MRLCFSIGMAVYGLLLGLQTLRLFCREVRLLTYIRSLTMALFLYESKL